MILRRSTFGDESGLDNLIEAPGPTLNWYSLTLLAVETRDDGLGDRERRPIRIWYSLFSRGGLT